MKLQRVLAVIVLLVTVAIASEAVYNGQLAFDKVKSLSGTWEGKTAQGKSVQIVFRPTSNGSSMLSEIMGEEDMITMFHMDGSRLLMTHYCGAGNQPRMQGTLSPDGKLLTFNFVDATNLASPEAGHMVHLVITMLDADHHSEQWTFVDHGKQMVETFELKRKT